MVYWIRSFLVSQDVKNGKSRDSLFSSFLDKLWFSWISKALESSQ